jgi:hypothetical protein
MKADTPGFRERHRFCLQTAAFLLMTLPPIPLYVIIQSGADWMIWPCMLIIYAGALLGLWAS